MQSRVSSSLAALTPLFLISAVDLVVAQISAPSCTESSWQWSFNSIGQNSCTVAAYLLGTCSGGVLNLSPIRNSTFSYSGPTEEQAANLCLCNTVTFNLLSACSVCQGGQLRTWSSYSSNCTRPIAPSTFPNPVPPDTRVPQWTLQDVTRVNLWNATTAFIIGDTPEILPGELIDTSASSSVSPTPSASSSAPASTSPVSTSSGSGSNTGAIAGGAAGGVIVAAAIAGLVFIFWRRRRSAQAPASAFLVNDASPPPLVSQVSHIHPTTLYDHTQGSPLYDPNNPNTYPQRQEGVPTSIPNVNVPIVSYDGNLNGNNSTNMQPLRPQGYHGLPTV
ncbi:hypothetical protein BJY52DRAFT_375071 [Lactarius psammicola]|nr:hypothetical protein BJY52DRAFT_375071 [Lactarius psammicola]